MRRSRLKKKQNYILGLDGLRTIAIVSVVFYHLMPIEVPGGFLGVNLFFTISGYLFTLKLERLMRDKVSFQSYIKQSVGKRWQSIFPPLLYTLALTVLFVALLQPKLLQNIGVMFSSSALFINNIVQIALNISYFERHFGQSVFTHFWYLSALLQMMLIWSIFYYVAYQKLERHKGTRLVALLLTLVSFSLMVLLFHADNITRVYYGTDTRFFDFLIGALVALIQSQRLIPTQKFKLIRIIGVSFAFISMVILLFIAKDDSPVTYYVYFLVFDLLVAYIIAVGLTEKSIILPFLENSITKYIGKRSFYWYLWYFPIFIFIQTYVSDSSGLMIMFTTLLIAVVAEVFYRLFIQHNIYHLNNLVPFYRQLTYLLQQKQWFSLVKGLFNYCLLPLTIGYILITAPIGQNSSVAQLQAQLAANAQLQAEQATIKSTETITESQSETTQVESSTSVSPQSENVPSVLRQITFIGDSVTLSMYSELKTFFPNAYIDGKVSRQYYQGVDVAKALARQGFLYNEVVIMLGANSPYSQSAATELLDYLGQNRKIYWVNLRGNESWHANINTMMNELTKTYKNLKIIDWSSYSLKKDEWFLEDGLHPNVDGIEIFTRFLAKELK